MDQLGVIEASLKELWEKAKQAGELIARLREENESLQQQNRQLEQEIQRLRSDVAAKEQHLQKLSAEESSASPVFSNGEREQLTQKVKELLARIDAYL